MSSKDTQEIMRRLQELDDKFCNLQQDIEPVIDLIKGATVFRNVSLWLTSLIIGIVGAYVAIKTLLK